MHERELEGALDALRGLGLILEVDDQILSLPTAPPRAPYIPVSEYPAGYVLRYDGTGPLPPEGEPIAIPGPRGSDGC
jgi:hypothetical protein